MRRITRHRLDDRENGRRPRPGSSVRACGPPLADGRDPMVNSGRHSARVKSPKTIQEARNESRRPFRFAERYSIRVELAAIFVSLELSRSKWLITSLSPGAGERMSKFAVTGGDAPGLLACLTEQQRKAKARTGRSFRIIIDPRSPPRWVLDSSDYQPRYLQEAGQAAARTEMLWASYARTCPKCTRGL